VPSTNQGHQDSGAPDIIPDIDYHIGSFDPDIGKPDIEPDIAPDIGILNMLISGYQTRLGILNPILNPI
jgi:hypothetical protein